MNSAINYCVSTFLAVVVIFSIANVTGKAKTDKTCDDVKCKDPPSKSKCTVMSDKSKGKQTECCPLWKCQDKKDGKNEFYTFHGLLGTIQNPGGTETVHYKSTGIRSKNGDPIYNVVESVATGKHDSKAFSSDSKLTNDEITKEIEDAFKGTGLNLF